MTDARKRTSSFSLPAPTKLQRTDTMTLNPSSSSGLRRTESLLSILPSDSLVAESMRMSSNSDYYGPSLPYYKTLQYHKDQRLKRQQSFVVLPSSDNNSSLYPPRPSTSSSTSLYSPSSLAQALTTPLKPKKSKRVPVPAINTLPLCPAQQYPASPNHNNNHNNKRPLPITPSPVVKHTQIFLPSARPLICTLRASSPLSPNSNSNSNSSCSQQHMTLTQPIPVRSHPRSRPEPDLYRKAIKQRMGTSPEGRKVLTMGPRLAMSIVNATRELERIVASGLIGGGCSGGSSGGGGGGADYWDDGDVFMADSTSSMDMGMGSSAAYNTMEKSGVVPPVLTNSWVLVRGEDWEMVDCAA